jgi:hypothetical protein
VRQQVIQLILGNHPAAAAAGHAWFEAEKVVYAGW